VQGSRKKAKLFFTGHVPVGEPQRLLVDDCLTSADGCAKRLATLHVIDPRQKAQAITLGANKGWAPDLSTDRGRRTQRRTCPRTQTPDRGRSTGRITGDNTGCPQSAHPQTD
jgi:hypothetical protein